LPLLLFNRELVELHGMLKRRGLIQKHKTVVLVIISLYGALQLAASKFIPAAAAAVAPLLLDASTAAAARPLQSFSFNLPDYHPQPHQDALVQY
jgi:hypothetical protein